MQIIGKVVKGKGRGKTLGFPTANLKTPKRFPEGVYIALTIWRQKKYPSLFFSGKAKTFNDPLYSQEVFPLDQDKNLYGETIRVEIYKKIRGSRKFSSSQELSEAIRADIQTARKYFT